MFYELVVSSVCGGGIQDLVWGGRCQRLGAARRRVKGKGEGVGSIPSPTLFRLRFLFHLTATSSLRQCHGRARESNENPSANASFTAQAWLGGVLCRCLGRQGVFR